METHFGKFNDFVGLTYQCGELRGNTGPDGQFLYTPDEDVSFSIGSLELGTTRGKPILTVLDLVDKPSITNPSLLNRARLLFTFVPGLGFEKPIVVDERVCLWRPLCEGLRTGVSWVSKSNGNALN